MESFNMPIHSSENLCLQTLKIFQNSDSTYSARETETIASLLRSIAFFKANIKSSGNLIDFFHEVIPKLKHEVHDYGTVLLRDNDHSDKLYIILRGEVQRLCQRSTEEVEKELRGQETSNDNSEEQELDHMEADRVKSKRRGARSSTGGPQRATMIKKSAIKGLITISIPNIRVFEAPNSVDLNSDNSATYKAVSNTVSSRRGSRDSKSELTSSLVRHDQNPTLASIFPGLTALTPSPLSRRCLRNVSIGGSSPFSSLDLQNEALSSRTGGTRSIENAEATLSQRERITEEHTSLIKEIASNYLDLKDRCFINEAVGLINCKNLIFGDCFGETFCQRQMKEKFISAVSSQEVHLITITREDYEKTLARINDLADERFQTLVKVFPSMSEQDVGRFSQYFSTRRFYQNDNIYHQGELPKALYFLQKGDVRLLRDTEAFSNNLLSPRLTAKRRTVADSIEHGHFFGEELLLKHTRRQHTAFINSQEAVVYILDSNSYRRALLNFPEFFKLIIEADHVKLSSEQKKSDEPIKEVRKKSQKYLTLQIKPDIRTNTVSSPRLQSNIDGRNELQIVKKSESEHNSEALQKMKEALRTSLCITRKKNQNPSDKNLLKSIEVYKNKFSRKISVSNITLNESFLRQKSEENRRKTPTSSLSKHHPFVFNVRRELSSEHNCIKFPKIPLSPKSSSKKENDIASSVTTVLSKLNNSPGLLTGKNFEMTKSSFVISTTARAADYLRRSPTERRSLYS